MVRDDQVHQGVEDGISLALSTQQLVHDLLRVDSLAGRLIAALPDDPSGRKFSVGGQLAIGNAIRDLLKLGVFIFPHQQKTYNGIEFRENTLYFVKKTAIIMHGELRVTVNLMADGVTKTISIR